MEEIIFEVQGSAIEPYKVSFIKHPNSNLSAYCTCPAGTNGQYCKHRIRIMDGDRKSIVSTNAEDVTIVQTWLIGTDLETALHRLRAIEKDAERIKIELSLAKKKLTKALHD